jgi:hypothetical protein
MGESNVRGPRRIAIVIAIRDFADDNPAQTCPAAGLYPSLQPGQDDPFITGRPVSP